MILRRESVRCSRRGSHSMRVVAACSASLFLVSTIAWGAPEWGAMPQIESAARQAVMPVRRLDDERWEKVQGCARTIAAGAVNQVLVTGCGGQYAHDTIYEWKPGGESGEFVAEPPGSVMLAFRQAGMSVEETKRQPAQASWLAIDAVAGKVYGIGPDSTLYSRPVASPYPHHQWTQFVGAQVYMQPMQVTAVAAGDGHGRGDLWAISAQPGGAGGNRIYASETCPAKDRVVSGRCWRPVDGAAQKVALGNETWVVSSDGGIFRRNGNGWQRVEGCARDVAANGGHVYVVGCDSATGGGGRIFRRVGDSWRDTHQTGKTLAVDVAGNLWVVKAGGEIWRRKAIRPDPVR